jgi:tetratricopeptide (TPR) repeat protein
VHLYTGGAQGVLYLVREGDRAVDAERQPNDQLAGLMAEAGLSNKGLAARVQIFGAKSGKSNSASHVSVRRWLNGTRPNEATVGLILQALGSKLGRPVSASEAGFFLPKSEHAALRDELRYLRPVASAAEAVDRLAMLTNVDRADSANIRSLEWSSQGLSVLVTDHLFASSVQVDPSPARRLSAPYSTAEKIRVTAQHLMDLDFKVGGGSTRNLLLYYFESEVIPLLRSQRADAERQSIFSAAGEVAQLLGWTAYDTGRHGAAQRYFALTLRLAREANDVLLGGRILANLSHQANYLGKLNEAVQLARAAQMSTAGIATPIVQAMFLAMEARALANSGNHKESLTALHRAEKTFERRSDRDEDPDWIAYFNRAELAGEAAHCFRDLGRAAETRQFGTEAYDPSTTPPRTLALVGMVNATGALASGSLDESIQLARQAISLADGVQSRRFERYLRDFRQTIVTRYQGNALVVDFEAEIADAGAGDF